MGRDQSGPWRCTRDHTTDVFICNYKQHGKVFVCNFCNGLYTGLPLQSSSSNTGILHESPHNPFDLTTQSRIFNLDADQTDDSSVTDRYNLGDDRVDKMD